MRKITGQYFVIPLKVIRKIVLILVIIVVFDFFLFPFPALASEKSFDVSEELISASNIANIIEEEAPLLYANFPENKELAIKWSGHYVVTAYNSEERQCDSTPCITASGFDVCEHGIEDTVAANFLEFGTKIRMPEIFGDRIFVVRDRMSEKYSDMIDIWMINEADARQFGRQSVKIEILVNEY
jgi:3D (Asp-Asp-Asp) domain-containing protein